MNLQAQILAAINFADLTAIVVTAGLALIGLSFLGFVLTQAKNVASGNIGESSSEDEEEKDEK